MHAIFDVRCCAYWSYIGGGRIDVGNCGAGGGGVMRVEGAGWGNRRNKERASVGRGGEGGASGHN